MGSFGGDMAGWSGGCADATGPARISAPFCDPTIRDGRVHGALSDIQFDRDRTCANRSGGGRQPGTLGRAGEWFGFCAVYFTVLAVESPSAKARTVAWPLIVFSVFVVGLTVSRGVLLGVTMSTMVALRRLPRRGLMAISVLACVLTAAYATGAFDRIAAHYMERGLEETGRGPLWPAVVRRIVDSPMAGVGVSHLAATSLRDRNRSLRHTTPFFISRWRPGSHRPSCSFCSG